MSDLTHNCLYCIFCFCHFVHCLFVYCSFVVCVMSLSRTPGRDSGFLAALRLLVGVVSSVPVYSPEAHHLYQAHLFHIMQSTLSSTPVPHHAINSPIKASSTFQSPPDRCTTQYEYMPANLCPEVSVFCQFLRN